MRNILLHPWLVLALQTTARVVLVVALFVALRWALRRSLQAVMRPLLARAQVEGESSVARLRTLEGLAQSSATYALLFVAVVTLLGLFGINVTALLAGAGVAGLALSFGAQRLVRDVLTGFFLMLEDQFRVGEVVTLVGAAGLPQLSGAVLEMGLRITRVRDASGTLITIGNGDIAAVVNHSRGPITTVVEVGVAPDTSLERVREIVETIELPEELFAGAAQVRGVSALEAERAVVKIAAAASPGRAPEAELTLRQLAAEALRGAGVAIK